VQGIGVAEMGGGSVDTALGGRRLYVRMVGGGGVTDASPVEGGGTVAVI
jgi:hypothetical protein